MRSGEYLLTRTAAAATAPVTAAEVKADLRIQHAAEDSLIESLILAATDYAEATLDKPLISQTWELKTPAYGADGKLYLHKSPVQSVTSISYYDANEAVQTLSVADFHLYGGEDWAYIVPKSNASWPTVYNRLDAITVTFVAGFGAAASVPENIKRAIRMIAGHWYENRKAVGDKQMYALPMAVESLLNMSRKGWVA